MFESLVMPLFFEYSNYHSFNRLVNAWSFRRISSGPDRGSYYHELFLRGKPHLQKYMRRLPKTHKKLPMKKKDEPDFYALDKSNPLPAVEDAPIPGAAATVQAMRASQQQQGTPTHMHMSHMDNHSPGQNNSTVVTPSLSPNQAQQIIAGSQHHHMMANGNMNVPNMGMGAGNMNNLQNGMQGGNMMGQQQHMMMNAQGMGNPGLMNAMQGANGMGMQGGRAPAVNSRFNNYEDLPSSGGSHDEYDNAQPQHMMGRNGYPMNNGFPGGFQGVGNVGRQFNTNNNNIQQQNGMRRPVPTRQGPPQMEHMHSVGSQQQQPPDFNYPGYGQQPPMLPTMQHQVLYNRGATASPGGNSHDDYSSQAGSQSNGSTGGGGGGGMSRLHQTATRG